MDTILSSTSSKSTLKPTTRKLVKKKIFLIFFIGKEVYEAKRPSVKDLPPIADYKYAHLQEELHPPGHEYLPPPKISKYTPPSENYKYVSISSEVDSVHLRVVIK